MNLKLVILLLALLVIATCRHQHLPFVSMGGVSPAITNSNLIYKTQNIASIDAFVQSRRPELRGARIISLRKQSVAGTNYIMVYRTSNGQRYEVKVFDQSWTKKR
jgi:hypothetical protein